MKNILFCLITIFSCVTASSQSVDRYKGGVADGFAIKQLVQTSTVPFFNKFTGGGGDGFTARKFSQTSTVPFYSKYNGGNADGFAKSFLVGPLSISETAVTLANAANSSVSLDVAVPENVSWSATSDLTWLTVSPSTATTGNGKLTLTATANTSTDQRVATVTVTTSGNASQTITVTQQAGEAPVLSLSSSLVTIAKTANSTATVTVTSNTTWIATCDQDWLTLNPAGSTKGNATLTFTAAVNPLIIARTATVTVTATGLAPKTVSVTQSAGDPSVSVSQTAVDIGKTENSTASVSVTSNTTWSATSNQTWLKVNPSSATGNGTLTFTATANTSVTTRSARVTITATGVTAKTVTITQAAEDPVLVVSQSTLSVSKTANSNASVTVTSNSTWQAVSDQSWLKLNLSTATGNATLIFTVAANPAISSRTATVTITAGTVSQNVTITQAAGDPSLSASLTSINVAKSANSTASISVSSNTTWTAVSDQNWLSLNPATSTTGNATLTFTAAANPATTSRTAKVTITADGAAPLIITVTQAAGDPFLLLSTYAVNIAKLANSKASVNITSNTIWSASSDQDWITVSPGSSTGNDLLTITANANSTIISRTATVTVSATGLPSQTIVVTQDAGDPVVSVSTTHISLLKTANSKESVAVNSNTTWTAISDQDWLNVNPSEATSGDATLTFTATANTGTTDRVAMVTISASGVAPLSITVTQTTESPVLNVTSPFLTMVSESSSVSDSLISNLVWNASSDASWLKISPASGKGCAKLTFSAEANLAAPRSGIITISAIGADVQLIIVTQNGITLDVLPSLQEKISIYPNPATEAFKVMGITNGSLLTIFTFNGQIVLTKEISSDESISLKSFPAGLYIVRIKTQYGSIEKKLIKQ